MADTWVVMAEIPKCDLCDSKAYADGKLNFRSSWAYMCKPCFDQHGSGLGLGKGQQLLLEPPNTTT